MNISMHQTVELPFMFSILWRFKVARISATRGHLCLSWRLQSAVLSKSSCIILYIFVGFLNCIRYTVSSVKALFQELRRVTRITLSRCPKGTKQTPNTRIYDSSAWQQAFMYSNIKVYTERNFMVLDYLSLVESWIIQRSLQVHNERRQAAETIQISKTSVVH